MVAVTTRAIAARRPRRVPAPRAAGETALGLVPGREEMVKEVVVRPRQGAPRARISGRPVRRDHPENRADLAHRSVPATIGTATETPAIIKVGQVAHHERERQG